MTIGESLLRFRKDFKLTQDTVAKAIGVLQQTIYKYESGKVTPSADVIVKLATVYKVDANYLLGLSDNPKTSAAIADKNKRLADVAKACYRMLSESILTEEMNGNDNSVCDNEQDHG